LDAGVILAEGEEKNVKAEDLVLIKNRNGNRIMAVTRGGLGSNENLRTLYNSLAFFRIVNCFKGSKLKLNIEETCRALMCIAK